MTAVVTANAPATAVFAVLAGEERLARTQLVLSTADRTVSASPVSVLVDLASRVPVVSGQINTRLRRSRPNVRRRNHWFARMARVPFLLVNVSCERSMGTISPRAGHPLIMTLLFFLQPAMSRPRTQVRLLQRQMEIRTPSGRVGCAIQMVLFIPQKLILSQELVLPTCVPFPHRLETLAILH